MSPLRRLFVIALWCAVAFAYVAALLPAAEAPHLGYTDKVDHAAAFLTVTILARLAYPRASVAVLFALVAAFGGAIELSQAVPLFHRDADWYDWFTDLAAALAGLLIAWPLATLADRRRARRAA